MLSGNGSSVNVNQWVDYDPWGLELAALSTGSGTNRNKFNGKEALSELGSGLLDFGARGYDAAIGRWGVVDPLAEVSRRFSPFVYGNNNPLRFIDPDGMQGVDTQTRPDITYTDGYGTYSARNSTLSMSSFSGAYQNNEGQAKGEEPQPKPGRLAQTAQQRQQQAQAQYQQMVRRGDGIDPDYPVESVLVGGAVFKPVTAAMGRFLGGILGRLSSGYSPIEREIIKEATQIMSNEKLLRTTFESGVGTELNIAGRTIIVEPGAPISGMTIFEENAFAIGREAFSSKTELTKTILHELYRLRTSVIQTSGASRTMVSQETSAAANFADRAISSFK